ncbi:protein-L-isoaspartate O-methyltransferase family protein [Streptomyces sp. CA-111067]|uniref:protein-L-isoaspartate O-methyltransferase family protein n=1 Tax=Streptomyces sp. CA-111067 TaxID=3240046 RepID=UPI003D98BE8D
MDWQAHAAALADATVHPDSLWHPAIAATPRHLFVPRWWRQLPDLGWTLRAGADEPDRWMNAAYSNRTLVTRVGDLHADHAQPDDHPTGLPTSSSTLPGLIVALFDHALLTDHTNVLCVTGSGYGTALLAHRLTDTAVTSIDIDPYLVSAATHRLGVTGLHPYLEVRDITGELPGRHDRIISTVALPGIPPTWLAALNDHGRLVTNLAGTGLILVADKTPDGGARGQIAPDHAGFMATRAGTDYPPQPGNRHAWTDDGETVTTGRYPVIQVAETWELMSAMALAVPGIRHSYTEEDGVRTAVMSHPDGSWARATGRRGEAPTVHQTGPRPLWDTLDAIRHDWLSDGYLPVYGATATIDPDGTLHLTRRNWTTVIPPPEPIVRPRGADSALGTPP